MSQGQWLSQEFDQDSVPGRGSTWVRCEALGHPNPEPEPEPEPEPLAYLRAWGKTTQLQIAVTWVFILSICKMRLQGFGAPGALPGLPCVRTYAHSSVFW